MTIEMDGDDHPFQPSPTFQRSLPTLSPLNRTTEDVIFDVSLHSFLAVPLVLGPKPEYI
jgi:hypothetical protein